MMRGWSGSERRVKVKTPKSGSDRLELVFDINPDGIGKVGDDGREPAEEMAPIEKDHREGYGYNLKDDGNGSESSSWHSGHSESTAETDNRSSLREMGINRTWSLASDNSWADDDVQQDQGQDKTDCMLEIPTLALQEEAIKTCIQDQNAKQFEEAEVGVTKARTHKDINEETVENSHLFTHLDRNDGLTSHNTTSNSTTDYPVDVYEDTEARAQVEDSMEKMFDEEEGEADDSHLLIKTSSQDTSPRHISKEPSDDSDERDKFSKYDVNETDFVVTNTAEENNKSLRARAPPQKAVSFDDSATSSEFDILSALSETVDWDEETSVESVGWKVQQIQGETMPSARMRSPIRGILRQPIYSSSSSVSSNNGRVGRSSQTSNGRSQVTNRSNNGCERSRCSESGVQPRDRAAPFQSTKSQPPNIISTERKNNAMGSFPSARLSVHTDTNRYGVFEGKRPNQSSRGQANERSRLSECELQSQRSDISVLSPNSQPPNMILTERKKNAVRTFSPSSVSVVSDISEYGDFHSECSNTPASRSIQASDEKSSLSSDWDRTATPKNHLIDAPRMKKTEPSMYDLKKSDSGISFGALSTAALDGIREDNIKRKKRSFFRNKSKSLPREQDGGSAKKVLSPRSLFRSIRRKNMSNIDNEVVQNEQREHAAMPKPPLSPRNENRAPTSFRHKEKVPSSARHQLQAMPPPRHRYKKPSSPQESMRRQTSPQHNHKRHFSFGQDENTTREIFACKESSAKEKQRRPETQDKNLGTSISSDQEPENHFEAMVSRKHLLQSDNPWADEIPFTRPSESMEENVQHNFSNPFRNNPGQHFQDETRNDSEKAYAKAQGQSGSHNMKQSGMPVIKWWTWSQPDETHPKENDGEPKDVKYCALMCMFPPDG